MVFIGLRRHRSLSVRFLLLEDRVPVVLVLPAVGRSELVSLVLPNGVNEVGDGFFLCARGLDLRRQILDLFRIDEWFGK